MRNDALHRNSNGYSDPTACTAIRNADREKKRDRNRKINKLVTAINNICDVAGFEIEGRIVLRDKKNGEIWR